MLFNAMIRPGNKFHSEIRIIRYDMENENKPFPW